MGDMSAPDLKLPQTIRPVADQILKITDEVCGKHLDQEYADLCRTVVGKLARKRPSPLARGDLRIWAAGVVYAVAQANFLFDPTQTPHASTDQLSDWLGVKKTTMGNKGRLIRDTLAISPLDPEYQRGDLIDANPLNWMFEVNGVMIDIRHAPADLQVEALQLGLISHLPDQAPSSPEELDRLAEAITTDCYNRAEQVTAFYEAFATEVTLPASATLAGTPTQVTGFDIAANGEEAIARCQNGDVTGDVRLSDLVFSPDAPAGWVHAAYRRVLGLEPHPSAMPSGWQPVWLS